MDPIVRCKAIDELTPLPLPRIEIALPIGEPNYGAGKVDQRGVARPQYAVCDVGAYEARAK